jgi:hypothetical protein
MELTKTRLAGGIWEGELTAPADSAPTLAVTHLGEALDGVTLDPQGPGRWLVRIAIPVGVLADGVQTILVADAATGDRLGRIVLIAGDALDDDLRADVDLLRAELDMLKRAFRRHCVETGAD